MTDIYDLSNKRLFTTQPNLNNYVTIASVVAAQIPLANIFNGQSYLDDIVKQMTANAQSNPQSITFTTIQKVLDFKMYRSVKPKVIFSAYISRVLPDNSNNIGTQSYAPVVQFKIDYDAVCVGSMMALFTVDVGVRSTIAEINVNGISANGVAGGVSIKRDNIYSIQYAYCTDFIYHYVDKVSIGFANTGGNAPIWHQEIPAEIIKIYHSMLAAPGMSATIRRAVREDQFVIGHQCYGQYGDFSFAVKSPSTLNGNTTTAATANGTMRMSIMQRAPTGNQLSQFSDYNELAVYWNDTEIKEVGFGSVTNQGYNPVNSYQVTFNESKLTGSNFSYEYQTNTATKTNIIRKLTVNTELYWRLGTNTAQMTLSSTNVNGGQPVDVLQGQTQYLKVISDEKMLIDVNYTDYPTCVINDEQIYIVPYLFYGVETIEFNVALIHPAPIYVTVPAEGGEPWSASTEQANAVPSIFNNGNTVTFAIIDNVEIDGITRNYGSQITFTVTSVGMAAGTTEETATFNNMTLIAANKVYANQQLLSTGGAEGRMYASVGTAAYGPVSDSAGQAIEGVVIGAGAGTNNTILNSLVTSNATSGEFTTLNSLIGVAIDEIGAFILQKSGAMSPVMQHANIAYINVDTKPYNNNDLALNSLDIYKTSNGLNLIPSDANRYQIFRYNAAIASMAANEEKHPNLINLDQQSIHTFRNEHGIVDFYMPLQFLFICQDISQSFPHYACAAQSILIKFEFNNPLSFINTSISVKPTAMDPVDFSKNERILINRVMPQSVLQTQANNMKYVLFYTRYAWVPILMPVLTQYRYYSWIIKNYERIYTPINNVSGGQTYTLASFNKSNFYTRIWTFLVTKETLDLVMNRGQQQDYIPICPNRFYLNQFDLLRFGNTINSVVGNNLTGSDATDYLAQQNSVYFQTLVDSFQLKTSTSINMTDDMPYRAQLLYPYLMLEHQAIESSMDFNNMFQFNIDPVFFQEGFPYAMYSPAFAPEFKLECTTKPGQYQADFGAIVIPEYINVSYISQHVMLLKYSTTN